MTAIPRRSALVVLATLASLAVLPSATLANPADLATTRTYIQANYALMRAATALIPSTHSAIRGLLRHVQRECPLAAAASPQETDSEQLSNEVIGAMVTSGAQPLRHAAETFRDVVGRLRWSNGALTRAVRAYVSQGKALFALKVPDVCADVKAWVAGKYQTLPASTVQFDKSFMPNWVAPGLLPAQLRAYEVPAERAELRSTVALEQRFTEYEASEVETWGEIMDALELQP